MNFAGEWHTRGGYIAIVDDYTAEFPWSGTATRDGIEVAGGVHWDEHGDGYVGVQRHGELDLMTRVKERG
jgi:hypothetical protein